MISHVAMMEYVIFF